MKFAQKPRNRGDKAIKRHLQQFEIGELASVVIHASIMEGRPHHRFHGNTGRIVARQGRAYVVSLKMGNKTKKIIAAPVHLRRVNA